ncbi:separase isoform X2 [Tanacetum coccineum]
MNVWAAKSDEDFAINIVGGLHPKSYLSLSKSHFRWDTAKVFYVIKGFVYLSSDDFVCNAGLKEGERLVHGLDSCLANLDNVIDSLIPIVMCGGNVVGSSKAAPQPPKNSTRIPLFYLFQVNSKGSGRPGELWKAPWGTDMIVDTILPDFKWIVKDFEDGISASTLDGRISNIIWLGWPMKDICCSISSQRQKKTCIILRARTRICQMLPWESMKELENQYIYRMPSVSSIFYTYQKCYKSQRKAVRNYASYATLDPFDAYYVINPTCITYGEYCLSEWLKNEFRLEWVTGNWEGLIIFSKGAPIDYVLAGSPIVVGNLWVVRQTWALEFTKKLLKTFEGELEDEAGIVACLDLATKI